MFYSLQKYVLGAFINLVLLVLFTPQSHAADTSIHEFWTWFKQNDAQIISVYKDMISTYYVTGKTSLDAKTIKTIGLLNEKLRKINPSLGWEISLSASNKQFIITANGDKKAYPAVINTVNLAPDFNGWTFVAFKQPKNLIGHDDYFFDNVKLNLKNIYYLITPSDIPGKVNLVVVLKNPVISQDQTKVYAGLLTLLDQVIGEYNAEETTNNWDIQLYSQLETQKQSQLKPISFLLQDLKNRKLFKTPPRGVSNMKKQL